jgi:metal-dependent amidase/aminoacylase/carboxypeptidase family protein
VFQPAEETLEGARAMLESAVLRRTAPDEIYALHCGPLPVGTFAVMPGVGQPGLDRFAIELSGPTAAADGQRLVAMIDALSTVRYPRTADEFRQLLDDLQTRDGPLARFVLAGSSLDVGDGRATVRVWLRACPDDRYPQLRDEVQRLLDSVGGGGRIAFPTSPFPAMVCSPELSEAAAAYLRSTPVAGCVRVLHAAYPFSGEDFGLFLQQAPGAMIYLGVANPELGIDGVPHRPDFAADERAIGIGVRAMAGLLSHRVHALH